MGPLIAPLLSIGSDIIKRVIPDPEAAKAAELELLKLQQAGELKELEVSMSAIVMEAQSSDPLTSRARPAFLYVMYIMILTSIPMGILFALNPLLAADIIKGVQAWLDAIPTEMWALFGAGYLGYTNKRSEDKQVLMGAQPKGGLLSKLLG